MSSMIYRTVCGIGDKLIYPILPSFAKPVWNHAAGPKTIFFWAPSIKWGLVMAGIADLWRPAEKLSLYQNSALCATGAIWTRYSFVIKPINYNLASVNIFLFSVGMVQIARRTIYEIEKSKN